MDISYELIAFLPLVIFLGAVSSITDIKTGKIRNKHLLLFMGLGIMAYLFLMTNSILNDSLNYSFLKQTITNFSFSAGIGFVFWAVGFWTAGDGKLFTVYSLLVPISVYTFGHISFMGFNFSSMNILINTFLPIFIFLFFNIMLSTSFKKKMEVLKGVLSPFNLFSTFISIFGYMWVINLIFNSLNIQMNMILNMVFVLILFIITEKVFMMSQFKFTLVIAILRLFFDSTWHSFNFFSSFILIVFAFMAFRYFIIELGFFSLTKEISIDELKEGMVLADLYYEENKAVIKRRATFFSIMDYFKDKTKNTIIDFKSEGISKKDLLKMKEIAKKNPNIKSIRVMEMLPFAPFMFGGVILTILCSGNFVLFIIKFF
jgi:archaeal preflagellin peptidase FlaK